MKQTFLKGECVMKTWLKMGIALLALMLSACGPEETPVLETVGQDACEQQAKPAAGNMELMIPEEAVAEAMADGSGGELYTWDDHTLQLQTLESGDIRRTVESLTGFDYDSLTVMASKKGDLTYYQTVWSAAGEEGTLLGRALIADDGYYHYCVSLLSPETSDSGEVYDRICATFSVSRGGASK